MFIRLCTVTMYILLYIIAIDAGNTRQYTIEYLSIWQRQQRRSRTHGNSVVTQRLYIGIDDGGNKVDCLSKHQRNHSELDGSGIAENNTTPRMYMWNRALRHARSINIHK